LRRYVDLEQDYPEGDNHVKKEGGARRGREMTTVEAILYARDGNEVYQRGAMRDEKASLIIALYKQQVDEMEASGEWATLTKVAKALFRSVSKKY
jgi:hypothetical protein